MDKENKSLEAIYGQRESKHKTDINDDLLTEILKNYNEEEVTSAVNHLIDPTQWMRAASRLLRLLANSMKQQEDNTTNSYKYGIKANYSLLSDAINHYESYNYLNISVPFLVSKEAYYSTKTENKVSFPDIHVPVWGDKYLVASGEQSFVEFLLEGRILNKACCITPCFRTEGGNYTPYHQSQFMKVELINTSDTSISSLMTMIHLAMSFFEKYLEVKIIETEPNTYDIVEKYDNLELGSYGIRQYKHLSWVYGTGVAEPRLSQAMAIQQRYKEGRL